MIKIRVTLLILIIALLLPLASCQAKIVNPDELSATRKGEESANFYFAAQDSNTALEVRLPSKWETKKADDSYQLLDGDKIVGVVLFGDNAKKVPEGFDTEIKEKKSNDIDVNVHIGSYKESRKEVFYRVTYTYTEAQSQRCIVTLEINQAEMDKTLYGWLTKPMLTAVREDLSTPTLSLSDGNNQRSVLIIGNSFVGSSYIGHILKDLISVGNQDCAVASKSIGYATITAYATQSGGDYQLFRERLAAGTYGIVFLCGLYSENDVNNIATLKALCDKSGTQLVILPAHNENATHIAAVAEKYPTLPLLNWKQQINAYERDGVAYDDLCIDDAHNHSTPLAGYIGAAMIYNALFGEEAPNMPSNCSVLSPATVTAKLGSHTARPEIYVPEKDIIRFSH
ncbi:MAG: hypothetical protein IJC99_03340 [Clostridia bacterium]|nr:hypothetical protein [Clostridia bacterium]